MREVSLGGWVCLPRKEGKAGKKAFLFGRHSGTAHEAVDAGFGGPRNDDDTQGEESC